MDKNMIPYSFLFENNQTITRTAKNARQFGYRYWKSGRKEEDSKNGVSHIYRTKTDKDGNSKIKRIMKKIIDKDDKKSKEK